MNKELCFTKFHPQPVRNELPEKFTFPFHYVPHPWSVRASVELMQRIEANQFGHDFGLHADSFGYACGKMFGVLVVENQAGEFGYLSAFSGKLGNSNQHTGFVPPLFDMLEPSGYFKTNEAELNMLNKRIEELESAKELCTLTEEIAAIAGMAEAERLELKRVIKEGKLARAVIRLRLMELSVQAAEETKAALNKESRDQQLAYKRATTKWRKRLDEKKLKLEQMMKPIEALKCERKQRSAALQNWLFEQYFFVNSKIESKSLEAIFEPNEPPAGAGDCAAPKLLQFAFLNGYRPLCLAEFWWGKSPAAEIRRHRHYYPACRSKCLPILGFMLEGMDLDANPLLDAAFDSLRFEIIAEDGELMVINKPSGLLSVPGKTGQDSVYSLVKQLRPEAQGPLIVHRLDRSTSGIMLIPKTAHAYRHLQLQFINRSIVKRYVALVEGNVHESEGIITLPIRPDVDDRPRQLVCFEHGREAITHWQKVSTHDGRTRIHFFPKTGRTHQLRVHAAHNLGLNAGICGDDLYGSGGERLKLHAESVTFIHPTTGQELTIGFEPDF